MRQWWESKHTCIQGRLVFLQTFSKGPGLSSVEKELLASKMNSFWELAIVWSNWFISYLFAIFSAVNMYYCHLFDLLETDVFLVSDQIPVSSLGSTVLCSQPNLHQPPLSDRKTRHKQVNSGVLCWVVCSGDERTGPLHTASEWLLSKCRCPLKSPANLPRSRWNTFRLRHSWAVDTFTICLFHSSRLTAAGTLWFFTV